MNNKGSDKNVANIEDIKVIQHIISFYKDLDVIHSNDKCKEIVALENVLAEREQKDKRIQELEVKLKCAKGLYDDCCNCLLNSIPKQVVIDKMEENKQILDKTNDGNLRERLYIENGILKELLERKK